MPKRNTILDDVAKECCADCGINETSGVNHSLYSAVSVNGEESPERKNVKNYKKWGALINGSKDIVRF